MACEECSGAQPGVAAVQLCFMSRQVQSSLTSMQTGDVPFNLLTHLERHSSFGAPHLLRAQRIVLHPMEQQVRGEGWGGLTASS